MNLVQIEENIQNLIKSFNQETFIFDLILAYGLPKSSVSRLRKGNLNLSKVEGEISWKKKLFFKEEFEEDLHLKILNIKDNIVSNSKNFFNNKSIVFTGTLNSISRDEAKHMAKEAGAKILSSVTKNTDYVIVGEKAGSKEKKARDLNINIFSEKDFLKKSKS